MVEVKEKKKTPPVVPDEVDPLPYIITFAILFLIMLGVLTWALDVWYKQAQCGFNPNIWCNDDWVCNDTCPTGGAGYSPCFASDSPTGLASCLFGPKSQAASTCYTPTEGGVSCTCPAALSNISNCLSGCPYNLKDVKGGGVCCCSDPTNPNCTPKSSSCQSTNG